ncbi:hypothetical protein BJX99DRAFT_261710 [Aspergillus californicus]
MSQKYKTDPNKNQAKLGFQGQGFDWASYIKYRPDYPSSFYTRIYNHHASIPSNTFDTAHDVGAGAGIVSGKLATRFQHVTVSEPNNEFLSIAKARLSLASHDETESRYTYYAERADKSSVAAGTISVLTICEAIHWTDIPASISEFGRQLKRNGTLCIILYGPVWILDNEAAQAVWEGLHVDLACGVFQKKEVYRRAVRSSATGLDNIAFPGDVWRDVKRIFTNTGGNRRRLQFGTGCGEEEDAVGEMEERVFVEDDKDWAREGCNLEWLQGVFTSFVPGRKVEEDLGRWEEMERALGKGGRVTVAWPNVQIIATRR